MKTTSKPKRHPAAHLSHRSYTGKRLPRQYTHYPILLFLLLCLGVFMVSLTLKVGATNVSVMATSEGPPPPAPAIITYPTEGDNFNGTPITVKGSCPARFMVKLYRNDVFSGAALCALDDTFQIQTDLFSAGNQLQARVFNAVEDEGPTSPVIQVHYDPPPAPVVPPASGVSTSPSASSTSPPTAQQPASAPLVIKADNLFKGYYTGDEIGWPLEFVGGTAPYALQVDWGDGTSSLFSRKDAGNFSIHHVYSKAGPNQGSFAIKLTATDADGNKTFLQLMVIVRDRDKDQVAFASPAGTISGNSLPPLKLSMNTLWPAYGVTVLMAASFWLGGRGAVLRLKPSSVRTRK